MNKLLAVGIKNYRSIESLKLEISSEFRITSICGENNVGKTNVLRAINLFFNPSEYKSEEDRPQSKVEGRWGKKGSPVIFIEIEVDSKQYQLTRDFRTEKDTISGFEIKTSGKKEEITSEVCDGLTKKFLCKYVPVLNLSIPNLINEIVEDMYDSEYETARFRGVKADLKEAYDKYSKGLLDILKHLAEDLTPSFKHFNENWEADVELSSNTNTFRELISDDLEFFVKDNSNKLISNKGSGLQRLTYLLILSRIIEKIKNKTFLLLLDEPDAYLHQRLQEKLHSFLLDLASKSKLQILLTTHSSVFIDTFHLRNVFLLVQEIDGSKNIRTTSINLDSVNGEEKIRSQLGIQQASYLPLDRYNILFEGESDLHYFKQLAGYFEITLPKTISANGVSNIPKLLEYYNSQMSKDNRAYLCIIFDDDSAGREVFNKVTSDFKKYPNLILKCLLVPNFAGEGSGCIAGKATGEYDKNFNCELEDFVYPELFCELANGILKKKSMRQVDTAEVLKKIIQPAFKSKGILSLFDHEKNAANPENGHLWPLNTSSNSSNQIKTGISLSFKLEGSRSLIRKVQELDKKYPEVRKFMVQLNNFEDLFKVRP